MSSDRIIITKKKPVLISNICSKCGFPVITVASIEARATKTYTFSQSKAEAKASETADETIVSEILRIEACADTKEPLVSKIGGNNLIVPGLWCESHIDNFDSPCPLCKNVEPWKSKNKSTVSMLELKEENFPEVFVDIEEANEWANNNVLKMIGAINSLREDDSYVEEMKHMTIRLDNTIDDWISESKNLPEIQQKEQMQMQLKELEKQNKSVGIFDFKRKKSYLTEIKATKSKISTLGSLIEDKQIALSSKIVDTRTEALKARAVGFGCTGEVLSTEQGNALTYFFEPCEIPEEFLNSNNININIEDCKSEIPAEVIDDNLHDDAVLFCNKCGFKLLKDSAFCSKCGNEIK